MLAWVFASGVITSFYEGWVYGNRCYEKKFRSYNNKSDPSWLNSTRIEVEKFAFTNAGKFLRAIVGGYYWYLQPVIKVFWLAGTVANGTSSLAIIDEITKNGAPGRGYWSIFLGKNSSQLLPCYYPVLTEGNEYPIDRPKLPSLIQGYYLAHTNYLDKRLGITTETIYLSEYTPPVKVTIKKNTSTTPQEVIMSFQPNSLIDKIRLNFKNRFLGPQDSKGQEFLRDEFMAAQGTVKIYQLTITSTKVKNRASSRMCRRHN